MSSLPYSVSFQETEWDKEKVNKTTDKDRLNDGRNNENVYDDNRWQYDDNRWQNDEKKKKQLHLKFIDIVVE